MKVRYTYKLRPGADARRALMREADLARYVWNALVGEGKRVRRVNSNLLQANPDTPREDLPLVSFGPADHNALLSLLRASCVNEDEGDVAWLAAGSSVVQQQTMRKFTQTRNHAFKLAGRGMPRFKSKYTDRPSLEYTKSGFRLKPVGHDGRDVLVLAGGITVPVVWPRPLPSPPSSVTVTRDSVGDWFASFVVDVNVVDVLPATGKVAGVDWGVKTPAAVVSVDTRTGAVSGDDDTAYDLPYRARRRTAQPALARYQRMMARRKRARGLEPSKGYLKAKRQAAKAHRKAARQRTEDARQWARHVVADHDMVAVEDFKSKFLHATKMARKAADNATSAARRELEWQARKAGRTVVTVPSAYTTMTCSNCGSRTKNRIPLNTRTYECETCGHIADRDRNAARNIAQSGLEATLLVA